MNNPKTTTTVLATALCALASTLACAQPPSYEQSKPDYIGTDLVRGLVGENNLYFRFGALQLTPDVKTNSIVLSDLSEVATVAVDPGPVEGEATADPLLEAASIIGYKLNESWSIETMIAMPPTLTLKAKGKLADEPLVKEANGIPTGVPALGEEIAETKAIPPMFTLVKRFNTDGGIQPYVGAGPVYFYTYDTHVTNPVLTELGEPDIDIENKFGWVGQLGVDIHLSGHWWTALDFKYISVTGVEATMEETFIRAPGLPQFQHAEVGTATFDADINAYGVTLGLGFTF